MKIGLVLSGGGARGAYQAGVLKALVEILSDNNWLDKLEIITGVSAGAINAAFLGTAVQDLEKGAEDLCRLWTNIRPEDVYRTDIPGLGKIGFRFLADIAFGSMSNKKMSSALLDTSPLHKLLKDNIPFEKITENGKTRRLAVGISAFEYDASMIRIFTDGSSDIASWNRPRRSSERVALNADHIMASAAIPILFPPVPIGNKYFGDGSLRNTAPISPAIHLGADRVLVVGVRNPEHMIEVIGAKKGRPTIGRTFGLMLNALFFDATDTDLERLNHVNSILDAGHSGKSLIRPIANLWIRPTLDLGRLALEYVHALPKSVGFLLGGLGGKKESAEIASYLLFDPGFCGKLVEMGYTDTKAREDELIWFFGEQS